MTAHTENGSTFKHRGVPLHRLNILLITLGMVFLVGMVYTMFQTKHSFDQVMKVSNYFINSQQTTGMLDSLADSMSQECRAFLADGDPSHVFAFSGQMDALNQQLDSAASSSEDAAMTEADQALEVALTAFWRMNNTEIRAMRLHAASLPVPLAAYPPLLQQASWSEEDQALSPEELRAAAAALLDTEEMAQAKAALAEAIETTHRLNSQASQRQNEESTVLLANIMTQQEWIVFLIVVIAVAALLLNRTLIIRPIQKSVRYLDQREPIPVRGSSEFRHLATVYNEVLRENQEKQQALAYTASHDALTGVMNRTAFEDAYAAHVREGRGGLAIVDVDHFKYFNDQHGHDVGDRVLKAVADAVRSQFRKQDQLCRVGGDEFVLLLKNMRLEHADMIREKVYAINQQLANGKDEELPPISISVGVAFQEQVKEGEDLFKCADIALLNVKENGRANCGIYEN